MENVPVALWRRIAGVVLAMFLSVGAGLALVGRYGAAVGWVLFLTASQLLMLVLPLAGVVLAVVGFFGAVVHGFVAAPSNGGVPTRWHQWLLVAAFILFPRTIPFALRAAVVEPFKAPAESMMPTLFAGDLFVINKVVRDVEPGDVIVFRNPMEPAKDFVKRVIAMPGDAVSVRDGVVTVNGAVVPRTPQECPEKIYQELGRRCSMHAEIIRGRKYFTVESDDRSPDLPGTNTMRPDGQLCPPLMQFEKAACVVEENAVFVLGDYRDNSVDSRVFGAVPVQNIKGSAVATFASFDRNWSPRWARFALNVQPEPGLE